MSGSPGLSRTAVDDEPNSNRYTRGLAGSVIASARRAPTAVSQEMLARVAGLHPSTISRIGRGANRYGMGFRTVVPLCDALGITTDHLLLEA